MNGDGMGSIDAVRWRCDWCGLDVANDREWADALVIQCPVPSRTRTDLALGGHCFTAIRSGTQIAGATIGTRTHQPPTEQGMARATNDKTKATDAKPTKPTKAAKPRAEKPATLGLCLSGSGLRCKGTFAPGGDARYKSDLIVNVINGGPADADAERARLRSLGYPDDVIDNEAAGVVSATRARAIIKTRGWTAHLEKRQDVARKRKEADQERAKAKAAKASASAAAKATKKAAKAARKTTGAPAEPEAADSAA